MAKVTTTIRQVLNYQPDYAAWFAENADLFNRSCAFYFGVIQAYEKILDLSNILKKPTMQECQKLRSFNPLQRESDQYAFSSLREWKDCLRVKRNSCQLELYR